MSALQKTDDRILYFDVLRIMACFAVIMIHLTSKWFNILSLETRSWMVLNVYNGTAHIAVPVFVMISGALFLDPEKRITLPQLLKKNILRIAAAFVFWSAMYSLADRLEGVRMRDVAFNFIAGHDHLWFLYMIVGLYLVTPLLRKLTESEKLTKYFLVLWFLFSVLFTSAEAGVSYFRSYFPHWVDVIRSNVDVSLVTGYVGYFVLGHYLHRQELSKKTRALVYALGAVGAVTTVVFTYLYSKRTGALDVSYYDSMALGVMLEAAAVFVLFKHFTPQLKNGPVRRLIQTAAVCSFGIFLVHLLVIRAVPKLIRFELYSIPLAVSIPLYGAAVFLISFLIAFILKKIPLVNRLIV